MKKGLLIVYSGPSGVGKSTILHEILKDKKLNLIFSVSMTTRLPRNGEIEGKDYFFVDKKTFKEAIKNDMLLEYARYVDNYYGTPRDYVEEERKKGKNVILEIDVQGGLQVIDKCKDCISIFVLPPSIEELRNRLALRGSEKDDIINKRVDEAQREIKDGNIYKYHIVNNDIKTSIKEVGDILKKEMAL